MPLAKHGRREDSPSTSMTSSKKIKCNHRPYHPVKKGLSVNLFSSNLEVNPSWWSTDENPTPSTTTSTTTTTSSSSSSCSIQLSEGAIEALRICHAEFISLIASSIPSIMGKDSKNQNKMIKEDSIQECMKVLGLEDILKEALINRKHVEEYQLQNRQKKHQQQIVSQPSPLQPSYKKRKRKMSKKPKITAQLAAEQEKMLQASALAYTMKNKTNNEEGIPNTNGFEWNDSNALNHTCLEHPAITPTPTATATMPTNRNNKAPYHESQKPPHGTQYHKDGVAAAVNDPHHLLSWKDLNQNKKEAMFELDDYLH